MPVYLFDSVAIGVHFPSVFTFASSLAQAEASPLFTLSLNIFKVPKEVILYGFSALPSPSRISGSSSGFSTGGSSGLFIYESPFFSTTFFVVRNTGCLSVPKVCPYASPSIYATSPLANASADF